MVVFYIQLTLSGHGFSHSLHRGARQHWVEAGHPAEDQLQVDPHVLQLAGHRQGASPLSVCTQACLSGETTFMSFQVGSWI